MDVKKGPTKIEDFGPVKNVTMEEASQKASSDPQSRSLLEINHAIPDFCFPRVHIFNCD